MVLDIFIVRLNELLLLGVVVYIVLCMVGVKNGIWQVVVGVVLIGVLFIFGLNVVVVVVLFFVGISMVLGGVVQMLIFVFKILMVGQIDNGKQNMYFFFLENMVVQGNLVLVLYGEMKIGLWVILQMMSIWDESMLGKVVVIGFLLQVNIMLWQDGGIIRLFVVIWQ